MHVLDFQAPALVRKHLTYLRATQFAGQLVALCFLPYGVIVAVETLDHQAERFQRIDATLLVLSSSAHPFHRMWIEKSENRGLRCWPNPSGQLHRSFGMAVAEPSLHCHTFVIDQKGILRLRVSRNIVDHDLEVRCKIVEVDRVLVTEHAANKEDTPDVTQRIWESSRGQTTS